MQARRVGFQLSVAFAVLTACDSPTPLPTSALDVQTVERLFERMDRLVTVLEASPAVQAPSAGGTERAPDRTLVAGDRSELLERIAALEEMLAAFRRRGGSSLAPAQRVVAPAPIRSAIVSQHRKQLNSEDEAIVSAAKREHFRLSEDQILQQYGMPSSSRVQQNGSVLWVYEAEGESSGFIFVNGLVTQMW